MSVSVLHEQPLEFWVGLAVAVSIDVPWFIIVRRKILLRYGRISLGRKLKMVMAMIVIAIFVIAMVSFFASQFAR